MYTYLCVFAISILLCYFFEKMVFPVIEKKPFSKIWIVMSLILIALLPSILGGVRDYSIGTDIRVYGNTWFYLARSSSNLFSLLGAASASSIGALYATFNFVVSRFTDNPHWFYFWYCFAENLIVLIALRENRKLISITGGWATYLLLFYNLNFNMLRQGMALVILLLGFKYIREEKFLKFILVVLFAYLFHNTAIIALLVYIIYLIIAHKNNANNWVQMSLIYICSIIFILSFESISQFLLNAGILSARYAIYLNSDNAATGRSYIFYLFIFIVCILSVKSEKDTIFNFFEIITFICISFSILVKISYLSRVISYFSIYLCFGIPYIFEKKSRVILNGITFRPLIMYILLIGYWLIIYAFLGYQSTVPFIFMTE